MVVLFFSPSLPLVSKTTHRALERELAACGLRIGCLSLASMCDPKNKCLWVSPSQVTKPAIKACTLLASEDELSCGKSD